MTESESPRPARTVRGAAVRIAAAVAVAVAFCLGVYFLLEAVRPASGLVSLTFLWALPAAVSAFVVYVGDPWAERGRSFYILVPFLILAAVIVASIALLREGSICVVLLSPLWLGSGLLGSWLVRRVRKRRQRYDDVFGSALLVLPLLAFMAEPMLPVPTETAVVSRAVIIAAPADEVWPLLRSIPDVDPGEGRWNLTQDVIGVPRPRDARLVGEGLGADRMAWWDRGIRFREHITEWKPGHRIGWRFEFAQSAGWEITDRHLRPDGPYFRVTTGGYTLTPLADGRTRVELETHYWIRTPLNAYARAWGEVFLGDIQSNLLAVVKNRAERP